MRNFDINFEKQTGENELNICSKAYKITLAEAQTKFKNSKIKKMQKIKSSNPRKFWKFLNQNKKPLVNLRIDDAYEHFKNINYSEDNSDSDTDCEAFPAQNMADKDEINGPISLEEIQSAVKCLKNNKSNGIDMILNEHIKYSLNLPHVKELYVSLFNLVFNTGIVPEAWSVGKIIPIYKQKGEIGDPSNYRPITLLSCMGKLFTAVINNRLQSFSEKYDKIKECILLVNPTSMYICKTTLLNGFLRLETF